MLGFVVGLIVVFDVVFAVVLVVFWVVFAVVTVDFFVVPDVVAVDFVTVVGFVVGWSLGLLHLKCHKHKNTYMRYLASVVICGLPSTTT